MKRGPRLWLLRLASTLIGVAVLLAVMELAFWILPVREATPRLLPSGDDSIARFRPNESWRYSGGWDFFIVNEVQTNNPGWVSEVDYVRESATPLLAFIGDSFVEGDHLPWADTCHGRLAQRLEGEMRVYSFGMNGAQLGQYLAYAEYVRHTYGPSALVIPIIENDFDRSLRRYQRARRQPVFFAFEAHSDGELVLLSPMVPPAEAPMGPVSRLRRWVNDHSRLLRYRVEHVLRTRRAINEERWRHAGQPGNDFFWTDPATADHDRLTASRRAVDAFLRMLPARSGLRPARVIFVVDGIRPLRYTEGWENRLQGSYHDVMRQYFMSQARAGGYEVIDMQRVFVDHYRAHQQAFNWLRDTHWNALGHGLCAEQVIQSPAIRSYRGNTVLIAR